MKKLKFFPIILAALLLTAALVPGMPVRALADPEITCKAAVVMDLTTGDIYYQNNQDLRVAPASVTKIMTALLAVEAVEAGTATLEDEVTAMPSMNYDLIAEGSSAGIQTGETMSLGNLLYCAMLSSANEACNIIAEHIGGSISAFVEMMNLRAEELGCTGTNFVNTHGLPNSGHYTTAADFCLIAREAAHHSLFMEIVNTPAIDVPATNLSGVRNLRNSNALISPDGMYGSSYLYPGASGIKTGHTSEAGYCLVSTAQRDGISLLAAVFGGEAGVGENGRTTYANFADSITLYDWVFNNFSYQQVLDPNENVASVDVKLGKDADFVNLRPAAPVTLLLPNDYDRSAFQLKPEVYSLQKGEPVTAPVSAGQVLGEISVIRNGQNCGTVKLVASSSVDLSRGQYVLSHIGETVKTPAFLIIALAVIIVGGLYVFWVIRYRVKRNQHRRAAEKKTAESDTGTAANREPEIEFFPNAEGPSGVYYNTPSAPAPAEPAAPPKEPAPAPAEPKRTGPELLPAEPRPEPERPAPPRRQPFFEMDEPEAPLSASQPSGPPAGQTAGAKEDPLSFFRDQADKDYFEEFFKKK